MKSEKIFTAIAGVVFIATGIILIAKEDRFGVAMVGVGLAAVIRRVRPVWLRVVLVSVLFAAVLAGMGIIPVKCRI